MRLVSLFLFTFFIVGGKSQDASWCPYQTPVYGCHSTSLFVLDATTNMKRKQVDQEFEFVRESILPGLSFPQQNVAFMSYGDGQDSNPLASNYIQACAQLYNIMDMEESESPQSTTLISVLQEIHSNYLSYITKGMEIVLFSATTSYSDISTSSAYIESNMPHVKFTVVALSGSSILWTYFPGYVIPVNITDLSANRRLANCLLGKSCGYSDDCYSLYSTVAPTTKLSTPKNIQTTLNAVTAVPNYSNTSEGPSCICDYGTSWNDVMLLFDSSDGTGKEGLQDLLFYMQTTFSWFNVQKTTYSGQFYTQIGIITYASEAIVFAPLGSLDSAGLMNITSLPYSEDDEANLEAAINLAANQLSTAAHRPNSRKVIVIFATSYNPAGANAPQKIANNFKSDNGIIIVYDYVQQHSTQVTVLKEIASTGYYVVNLNDTTGMAVSDRLCDANCFCPPNYTVYKYNNPPPKTPAFGCYYSSTAQANEVLAGTKCSGMNGGSLAIAPTLEKTQFLSKQIASSSSMWLGMTYDSFSNSFKWVDGEPVSSYYSPWCGERTTSTQNCVVLSNNNNNNQYCWKPTDCRLSYQYICQLPPCDSTHYCNQPEGFMEAL